MLFIVLCLMGGVMNKIFEGKVKVCKLVHKDSEGFMESFEDYNLKLTNTHLIIEKQNEFGGEDPNAIKYKYRYWRYIYSNVFVKWSLFKEVLDWKDNKKLFYLPFQKEIKLINKNDHDILKESYLL